MSCGTSRLSENEAIHIAEKYVLEHGYTNKKITIDSIGLNLKTIDAKKNKKIDSRYNTLKPKAKFYSKGLRRWTVGFQTVRDSTRYRIVRIYKNGKIINMEHQDLERF